MVGASPATTPEPLPAQPAHVRPLPRTSQPNGTPRTVVTSNLVDREYEMSVLSRAVQDLGAGTGGTVLIEGSAGIGKTRLLAEAGRLAAAAGVQVLSARGSELERAFGFGTVHQLFEPLLLDPERRETLLTGAAAGSRGVFDAVWTTNAATGRSPCCTGCTG